MSLDTALPLAMKIADEKVASLETVSLSFHREDCTVGPCFPDLEYISYLEFPGGRTIYNEFLTILYGICNAEHTSISMTVLSCTRQDHMLTNFSSSSQQFSNSIVLCDRFIDWSVIVLFPGTFCDRNKSFKCRDSLWTMTSNILCKEPTIVLLHGTYPLLIIFR